MDLKINTKTNQSYTTHADSITDKCENKKLTSDLFERIQKILNCDDFVRPNTFTLSSKYHKGGQIGLHTDTPYYISKTEYSKYKVLIYLNDDFEGGHTEFYDDNFVKQLVIVPKQGACVIFDMDIFHKGNEVLDGLKYWIGFEIISNK
jgi:hypothetical protein